MAQPVGQRQAKQVGGNFCRGAVQRAHQPRCADAQVQRAVPQGAAHNILAAAGQRFGFATVGLLRGEAQDTPTVRDLQAFGMQLHWLGYGGYRRRHSPDFWQPWRERYPQLLPVDEGGGGLLAARSCAAIVEMARQQLGVLGWADYHGWWLAAGTGTTAAGLVMGEQGAINPALAAWAPDALYTRTVSALDALCTRTVPAPDALCTRTLRISLAEFAGEALDAVTT